MISQTASPSAPESASRRIHPNEHPEVLMTEDLVKIYAGRAVVNGIPLPMRARSIATRLR